MNDDANKGTFECNQISLYAKIRMNIVKSKNYIPNSIPKILVEFILTKNFSFTFVQLWSKKNNQMLSHLAVIKKSKRQAF